MRQQAELFQHQGAELTVYQGKPRKNVCILSTVHTGVGTFSWAKAKPESVMYYNNIKYGGRPGPDGEGVLCQRRYAKTASGDLL